MSGLYLELRILTMIAGLQQHNWHECCLGSQFQSFLDLFIWISTRWPSSGTGSLPAVAQTVFLWTELLCPPHLICSHEWVEGPPLQLKWGSCSDSCPFPLVTGRCARCGENVVGEGTGCTAMDQVFHVECFTCIMCNNKLRGQPFYAVEKKAYCEPCYIVSTHSLCALILMHRHWKHLFLSLLWGCLTVKIWQPCGSTMSTRFFHGLQKNSGLLSVLGEFHFLVWPASEMKWTQQEKELGFVIVSSL